jgi:hypothetical protein
MHEGRVGGEVAEQNEGPSEPTVIFTTPDYLSPTIPRVSR